MNTPSPCNTCLYCRYDVMTEDDPRDMAWCGIGDEPNMNDRKKAYKWGDPNCPLYERYDNHINPMQAANAMVAQAMTNAGRKGSDAMSKSVPYKVDNQPDFVGATAIVQNSYGEIFITAYIRTGEREEHLKYAQAIFKPGWGSNPHWWSTISSELTDRLNREKWVVRYDFDNHKFTWSQDVTI